MTRQWKQLSLEDAKRHPLYGIKNWLAVYGFLLLIGPLVTIGQFSNSAHQSGLTLPQLLSADIAAGAFIKATIAFNVAIAALSFWFLFSKHQHFRVGSIALLVLQWPAYLVVLFIIGDPKIPGLAAELTIRFLSSLLWIVVWVTYLQRSRRVRVTFENCVVVESSQASAIHEYRMPFSKTLPMTSDNDVYAAALAEIEEQRVNKGTWARSFAESDGDESKAKATYIKLRVAALTEQATRKEAVSIGSEPTQEKTENSYLIDVARQEAFNSGLNEHDVNYLIRPIKAIRYLSKYGVSNDQLALACTEQRIKWCKGDILWVADEPLKKTGLLCYAKRKLEL